jgi:glycerophosphoryl diester phosphodiesterase
MAHAYADAVSPKVIAHRGANDEEPEHSLAAYLLAIEQGADGIECDVRLTADGQLVCVHDRRIDRTSTGHGAVSSSTYADLAQFDYSGSHAKWIDYEPKAEIRSQVLTLDRLISTVLDASSTATMSIETKHPTRFAGYVERELADTLAYFGLTSGGHFSRVRVMSFSWMAVRRAQRLMPQVPTVYLMDPVPWPYRRGTLPKGVGIAGPGVERLRKNPDYIARLKEQGHDVHVWTVDAPEDVQFCVDHGVDAIISNRPRAVLDLLGR